jgi:hypothetical protein
MLNIQKELRGWAGHWDVIELLEAKSNVFGRQLFRAMLDGRGQENAPPFAE